MGEDGKRGPRGDPGSVGPPGPPGEMVREMICCSFRHSVSFVHLSGHKLQDRERGNLFLIDINNAFVFSFEERNRGGIYHLRVDYSGYSTSLKPPFLQHSNLPSTVIDGFIVKFKIGTSMKFFHVITYAIKEL